MPCPSTPATPRDLRSRGQKNAVGQPLLLQMDTVTILRRLRRHRGLVVLAATWALLVGLGVAYRIDSSLGVHARQHTVALATARLLVDTPSSQVVQVSPKGSDALGVRATLLSNLMVDGTIKDVIARR